ncbi:MAG: hypothetical protein BWY57_01621 [Betaproteobacteria bacterium ADurb.Bin341]|nr:MAG: hypothetical protein BWY57_01621 [Betaproteobacteria bacterium ADurb.Bin341]
MPVSQSDIDALNTAIAQGERVIRKGDKSIEYRSIDELISARDDLVRRQVDEAVQAGANRPKQTRLYHGGRGFQ